VSRTASAPSHHFQSLTSAIEFPYGTGIAFLENNIVETGDVGWQKLMASNNYAKSCTSR
jgi:hypothetical protein